MSLSYSELYYIFVISYQKVWSPHMNAIHSLLLFLFSNFSISATYFRGTTLPELNELVMVVPLLFNTVSVNFGTVTPFSIMICHLSLYICFHIRSRNKNALADPPFHKSYLGSAYFSKNCIRACYRSQIAFYVSLINQSCKNSA
jgi:hypothetical protein